MRPLHLRLFLRIIGRNRDVFFLKVITLSIAFACAIAITLFVFNETGYDNFHDNADYVFRMLGKTTSNEFSGNPNSGQIPKQVADELAVLVGDSLTISPVKVIDGLDITIDDKVWHGQKLHAAAPSIASIFTFKVVDGSWADFNINQPGLVLSSGASRKFFGTVASRGRVMKISTFSDTVAFTVAAVFEDFPRNSHEDFEGFMVFDPTIIRKLSFDPSDFGVYGRVNGNTIDHFQKVIDKEVNNVGVSYTLQRIEDIYFGPRVNREDSKHGDEYSIYILISITSLILFLAITGFVNLTVLTLPSPVERDRY
jgi:putative ABC transport system permease protein